MANKGDKKGFGLESKLKAIFNGIAHGSIAGLGAYLTAYNTLYGSSVFDVEYGDPLVGKLVIEIPRYIGGLLMTYGAFKAAGDIAEYMADKRVNEGLDLIVRSKDKSESKSNDS